jgi:hypothetical protein
MGSAARRKSTRKIVRYQRRQACYNSVADNESKLRRVLKPAMVHEGLVVLLDAELVRGSGGFPYIKLR